MHFINNYVTVHRKIFLTIIYKNYVEYNKISKTFKTFLFIFN